MILLRVLDARRGVVAIAKGGRRIWPLVLPVKVTAAQDLIVLRSQFAHRDGADLRAGGVGDVLHGDAVVDDAVVAEIEVVDNRRASVDVCHFR